MSLAESRLFDIDDGGSTPFGDPINNRFITDIETESRIWTLTPQLCFIAAQAAQMEISPWGLLAMMQAHRATHVPPNVVLVDKRGRRDLTGGTSLNTFIAATGDTGEGKSDTFSIALTLLPPATTPVATGTGQGILRTMAYTEIRKKDADTGEPLDRPQRVTIFRRHEMMIHAPEVKSLNAEFLRDSSQTDSILRSVWIGETVGMTNADEDRRLAIPPNMIRVCGAWGVQPVNAGAILAQAPDGTPQRFLWAPCGEFRDPYPQRPAAPQGVSFPMPVFSTDSSFGISDMPMELNDGDFESLPQPIWVEWSPQMHREIPKFRAQLRSLRKKEPYERVTEELSNRREAAKMKSHLLLLAIKLAAHTGWIHGRANPSDDDWEIAKAQAAISAAELAGGWQDSEEARAELAAQKGKDQGIARDAAEQAAKQIANGRLASLAEKLHGYLCQKAHTAGALRERINNPETKQLVDAALNYLKKEARAEIEDCGRGKILWHALVGGKRVAA